MEYGSHKAAIEAAERKIARLTKQRDELQAELAALKAQPAQRAWDMSEDSDLRLYLEFGAPKSFAGVPWEDLALVLRRYAPYYNTAQQPVQHKPYCMKLDPHDERDWGCTCGAEAAAPQPAGNAELKRVVAGVIDRAQLRGFYVPQDAADLLESLRWIASQPASGAIQRRALEAIAKAESAPQTAGNADAARLNFLDKNSRFQMGWSVRIAPAGNVSVGSIIQLGGPPTTIREAIDAAIAKAEGGK